MYKATSEAPLLKHSLADLSDDLDYCEAPAPPDWSSKMPDSTPRVVIDHLRSRHMRYERLSPIHSTDYTVQSTTPRLQHLIPRPGFAAHEAVYHQIGVESQLSYDGKGDEDEPESNAPSASRYR